MALKKLGKDKWSVKAALWVKHLGYPISKQTTVTGSRAEALIVEAELLKELKARSLTSVYVSTFGDAVDLYAKKLRLQGRLSESHAKTVDFVRRALGHVRIECFADQLEAYRKRLQVTPTVQGKPRKAASVNRYTSVAHAVFEYLAALGIVAKNPVTPVRFPKMKETVRDRYISQEERLRLMEAIRAHRPYLLPIISFMLAVPCRVGELLGARREQYNAFTNTVYIPNSKAGIPIHKPVPAGMTDYFRSIPPESEWLFFRQNASGKYVKLVSISKAWWLCLRAAGIADLRIHDLRHIAATDLYAVGNPERRIMGIAGWKTNMLSLYRHKDSLRDAQATVFSPVTFPPADFGGEAVAELR
jgi:integrase